MKKYLSTAALSLSLAAAAQNVGINTTAPAATLDVVGKPAVSTALDGFIAPRITATQLSQKTYTSAQDGALVYVTDNAAGTAQASNVSGLGYYYFSAVAGKWIRVTTGTPAAAIEPWYKLGATTQATANTDDIYQTGRVSVGDNTAGGKFSVYDKTSGNNITIAHFENRPSTGTQSIDFMGNLNSGAYTLLSNTGDQAIIFEVGNGGGPPYLNSGLVIAPHVNGGRAVPYGMKITQQGLSGFGTVDPSETLDVGGSFRVRKLPLNGAANAIYTNASGSNSLGTSATGPASNNSAPVPTQTFTAVNTVVADANGVLGYVQGLPNTGTEYLSGNTDLSGVAAANLRKVYFFNAGTSITITMPPVTGNDGKELVFYIYGDPTSAETVVFTSSNSSAGKNSILTVANGGGWSVPDGLSYSPNTSGGQTYPSSLTLTVNSTPRKQKYHRRRLVFLCDGSNWIFDHSMN